MDDAMMSDNIFDALPTLSGPVKAALADELTRYLAAPVERTRDPLLWWVEKQTLYPCLSRMARDYLCIPGMFVFLGTQFNLLILPPQQFQSMSSAFLLKAN